MNPCKYRNEWIYQCIVRQSAVRRAIRKARFDRRWGDVPALDFAMCRPTQRGNGNRKQVFPT